MRKTGTVSFFFRDQAGLEGALALLPDSGPLNIWCAGCSAGQEPFTIAILLAEQLSEWRFRSVKIIATDIEEKFANRLADGVYSQKEMFGMKSNPLTERLVAKYCEHSGNSYMVVERIRQRVRFFRHDLFLEYPVGSDFNLITCKNLLEYFNVEEKQAIYEKLHMALAPGGILVTDPKQRHYEFEAPLEIFDRLCHNCVERVYRKKMAVPTIVLRDDKNCNKVSSYRWMNIEADGMRVGKARVAIAGDTGRIYSVMVFPEYERRGYARQTVDIYKARYRHLIADRVRGTARGFWQRLGFVPDGRGNYVWDRES